MKSFINQILIVFLILTICIQPSQTVNAIDSTKVAVLFIHGYNSDESAWSSTGIFKELSSQGILCKSINYEAYNRNDLTSSAVMNIVDNAIQNLPEGKKFDVIVHSMGGLVIRWYLLTHPEMRNRIRRVIFIGTPNHGSHGAMLNRITDFIEDTSDYINLDDAKPYKKLCSEYYDNIFERWDKGRILPFEEWLYTKKSEVIDTIRNRENEKIKPIKDIGLPIADSKEDYRYSGAFEEYGKLMYSRYAVKNSLLKAPTLLNPIVNIINSSDTSGGNGLPAPNLSDEITKQFVEKGLAFAGVKNIVQDRLMLQTFRMNIGKRQDGQYDYSYFNANPFLKKLNEEENQYRSDVFDAGNYIPQYITIATRTQNYQRRFVDLLTVDMSPWPTEENDSVVPVTSVPIDYKFYFDATKYEAQKDIPHVNQPSQTELLRTIYNNPLTCEPNGDSKTVVKNELNKQQMFLQGIAVINTDNFFENGNEVTINSSSPSDLLIINRDKDETWGKGHVKNVSLLKSSDSSYSYTFIAKSDKLKSGYVIKSQSGAPFTVTLNTHSGKSSDKNLPYLIDPIETTNNNGFVTTKFRVIDTKSDNSVNKFGINDIILQNGDKLVPFYNLSKETKVVKNGDSVLLALDFSGSMEGQPKIMSMNLAENYILQLNKGIKIGAIGFSKDVNILSELTDDIKSASRKVYSSQTGNTPLYDAIITGSNMLSSQYGNKTLIVMTDGSDTASKSAMEQAITAANQHKIPVYIVCLGGDVKKDVIGQITSRTSGQAYYTYDVNELASIYHHITSNADNLYTATFKASDLSNVKIKLAGSKSNTAIVMPDTPKESEKSFFGKIQDLLFKGVAWWTKKIHI